MLALWYFWPQIYHIAIYYFIFDIFRSDVFGVCSGWDFTFTFCSHPLGFKMLLILLAEFQLSSVLCSGVISCLFFRFPVIFLWCKPIPIIPRTGTGSENRVMAFLEFFRGTEDEKTFACTRNYMKNKGYYKTIRICLTRKKNLTGNYWKWWNLCEYCVLN